MPLQPSCAYSGAGARVILRDPDHLNKHFVMANLQGAHEHCLHINAAIAHYGDITERCGR